MSNSFKQWLTTIVGTACIAACGGDDPVAPPQLVAANLGSCTNLATPANVKVAAHVFATGVQIYRFDGNAWVLISPSAVLTDDEAHRNTVGMHYQGPAWEALDGSKVTATAAANCTPDATAIPWLLLNATATSAPGVFAGVTHIHRVNTIGGRAPAALPGTAVGALTSVSYKTEYFFYKPQ